MENKEKIKRKISVLTIFLWLALIVTMSVVVISGINKSNALEEDENTETRKIILKVDLTEIVNDEDITEQEEIDRFLEEYAKRIYTNVVYKESERSTIGVYEFNASNSLTKIIFYEDPYHEVLCDSEVLELSYGGEYIIYRKELVENIDEYNFVVRKKDTKKITVKIDFGELIDNKGITEQSEIENYLSNYSSRIVGRKEYDSSETTYISQYCDLKVNYIGSKNSKIGIYEAEITNDMKYIQLSKTWDYQYLEISMLEYDMNSDGRTLKIGGNFDEYGYINQSMPFYGVYIQKILEKVDEYNISIEKRVEVTINVSEGIEVVDILDTTNKIVQKTTINDGKINLKLSRGLEYDIIFAPYYHYNNSEYAKYGFSCITEDGNELEQKMVYTPSYKKEIYNYYKTIKQGEIKSEYNFETKSQLESNILWEDDKHAKLQFRLIGDKEFYGNYTPYSGGGYYDYYLSILDENVYTNEFDFDSRYIVFIEKLDENFSVSNEYEKDSKWLIVNEDEIKDSKFVVPEYSKRYLKLNLESNEYIPEYVYANFFVHNFDSFDKLGYNGNPYIKSNEKIYNIYIKDKNMLYCLIPVNKPNNILSINLEYKGDNNEKDEIFKFNSKSILLYNTTQESAYLSEQPYVGSTLIEKQIKYNKDKKTRIIVNKSIDEKNENNTYYVGLFNDNNENMTDKIYNINIENGVGSTKIEFDGYDETKKYFIYEVDENGNKILDENLIYNKNKVLENPNKREEYNILSDESVISSVYSTSANEGYLDIIAITNDQNKYIYSMTEIKKLSDDIGKGMGEKYYKNNSLIAIEVYEDIVTISESNEKPYLVRYETKKGGKLEGKIEEIVIGGEKPVNVPSVIANDGYEFDKWVVIKDGEEFEVNPSEYVVLEDTTFIAKYKEIKVEENRDTSDVNIWLYVGIAIISVIVVIIIVIFIRLNKKR